MNNTLSDDEKLTEQLLIVDKALDTFFDNWDRDMDENWEVVLEAWHNIWYTVVKRHSVIS